MKRTVILLGAALCAIGAFGLGQRKAEADCCCGTTYVIPENLCACVPAACPDCEFGECAPPFWLACRQKHAYHPSGNWLVDCNYQAPCWKTYKCKKPESCSGQCIHGDDPVEESTFTEQDCERGDACPP